MPKLESSKQALIAAVEGGGTSFIVTIALVKPRPIQNITIPHTRFEILHQETILTTAPSETLANVSHFFSKHRPEKGYDSLGICTFGPVGVNPKDRHDHTHDHTHDHKNSNPDPNPNVPRTTATIIETNYGRILSGSPKKDWRKVDILSPILKACSSINGNHIPLYKVDTDVNAPAMAEYEYTRTILQKDISSLAYVTVGTGIGVGLVIHGKPVHGMMHPEGGHVPVVPMVGTGTEEDEDFAYSWGGDTCPFEGRNTAEGTASSVALTERLALRNNRMRESVAAGVFLQSDYDFNYQSTTSASANASANASTSTSCGSSSGSREGLKDLDDDDPLWDQAANALANLCVTLALVVSVEKIVFGGGVMNREVLFDKIRKRTRELLNGYLDLPQVTTDEGLDEYIGPSVWKEQGAGVVGALVLAQLALEEGDDDDNDGNDGNGNGTKVEKLAAACSSLEEESSSRNRCTSSPPGKFPMGAIALYSGIFALGVMIGRRHKQ